MTRPRSGLILFVTSAAFLTLALTGCGRDSVTLAFRPQPGAHARFISISDARTQTDLPGTAPDLDRQQELLLEQRVQPGAGAGLTPVDVDATFMTVTQNGLPVPAPDPVRINFQVDGTGHALNLATPSVTSETVRQGLPEITAAFPRDPVRPGQRWVFPPPVGRSGFSGTAHLVRLGQRNGLAVAEIEATLSTAVDETELRGRDGPVTLGGPLILQIRGVYEVATGLLVESHQELTGDFRLRFNREGSTQPPVSGTQKLTVTTDTRRA